MQWKTKNGKILEIREMTDSHIRNAWAFVFKQLSFGVSDGQIEIFDAFRLELKRRHQWNLKLELQYADLQTRNKIHQIAEEMIDYGMHECDYY